MFLLFQILLLLIFTLLLVKATDVLIESLNILVRETRFGKFALASFLLGITTTLPEMVVGVVAALEGKPVLALGNVIGSNIANIALVVGLAALAAGTIKEGTISDPEFFITFFLALAPIFLLIDKNLSRVEALILISLYLTYNFWILRSSRSKSRSRFGQENVFWEFFHRFLSPRSRHDLTRLFAAIALLLFSADMLVRISINVAEVMQIPLLLLGFFVIAIGTSAPELIISLRGAARGEGSFVLGDILGSITANSCLIMGITALIKPIQLPDFNEFVLGSLVFALVYLVFYLFVRSGSKLTRLEGLALLSIYLLFVVVEVWK